MGEKAAKPFQFRQSPTPRPRFRAGSAINFFHPVAFWLGTGAVIAGVIGHIPMFVSSAEMNFRMAGMQMGLLMTLGMYAIVVGTVLVGYGLLPPDFTLRRQTRVKSANVLVRALDNAKLTPMHWKLFAVLVVALIVDVMKPATLGFVMPGAAEEYGLSRSQAAMMPVAGIAGTIVPARHRGWLVVMLGGIGTTGGYLAASGFAAILEPIFGWRIMWFLGLPTGVILVFLNRYIPESPRFLLAQGKTEEANWVMESFGVAAVLDDTSPGVDPDQKAEESLVAGNLVELFRRPFTGITLGVGLYGLAWGLVNFGFLLWLPLNLREMGMGVGASNAILAKSAVIAFPSVILVAWLYHAWSSKHTMVLFAFLTAIALLGFAMVGAQLVNHPLLLRVLVVALLLSSSGTIAMLLPYTAELYPVHIRATGSGWSAGCSKVAGVATLSSAVAGLTPGIAVAATMAAAPILLAGVVVLCVGLETRGLGLEAIQDRKPHTRSMNATEV